MNGLEGKVALVTGGTSGIGRQTVERFLEEGATVVTTAASQDSADRAQAELGEAVTVLAADALDLEEQRNLAETVARRFGDVDVLVLNAGVSDWRPIGDWDEAAFDRVFDINVKATFFLMQAMLPHLARGASVIVTWNLRDFPAAALRPFGLRKSSPDAFLMDLYAAAPDLVIAAAAGARANLRESAHSAADFVDALRRQKLKRFAEAVSGRISDL